MYQNLLKRTTAYCFVFFVMAMVGMCYFDANKVIVITDSGEGTSKPENEVAEELQTQYQLLLEDDNSITNKLVIPLEDTIMAEDVQIQNHYIDNELWIGIEGATTEFYSKEYVRGNMENVQYGGYDVVDEVLWIKFALRDTFEFESTMNKGKLTIKAEKPREIYEKIIVIDAGHGGEDRGYTYGRISEKDIVLDVLLLLQERMKESDIKVYYTRTDDSAVDNEKRAQLANNVDADMLISIHMSYAEDLTENGVTTIYNGDYFIQDFNSIALANELEQAVAGATGAKANGLLDATEEEILIEQARIPAAQVNIGYLSNEEELDYLTEEEYQRLIADGIYKAIIDIYEETLNR